MKHIHVNEDRFAAPDGTATDQAASSPALSGAQLEPLREYVRVIARQVLTKEQAAAVGLVLGGRSQQEAASELGWSETKMTRVLHGASPRARSKRVSAISKLADALRVDEAFEALYRRALEQAEQQATVPPPDAFITDWYTPAVTPPRPDLVAPRAVLRVASLLADKVKKQLRLDELCRFVPKSVVTFSLSLLSSLGYWRFDGVVLTIIKTPMPVPEPASTSVDPLLLTIFEALVVTRSAA
jgi:hypothetical protein